jgi:hypothetical protein
MILPVFTSSVSGITGVHYHAQHLCNFDDKGINASIIVTKSMVNWNKDVDHPIS